MYSFCENSTGVECILLAKIVQILTFYLQENPIKFQKNYESSDFNDIDGTLTELKEMQQILRDKYSKKSIDLDEEDYNSKRTDRKINFVFTFMNSLFILFI